MANWAGMRNYNDFDYYIQKLFLQIGPVLLGIGARLLLDLSLQCAL